MNAVIGWISSSAYFKRQVLEKLEFRIGSEIKRAAKLENPRLQHDADVRVSTLRSIYDLIDRVDVEDSQ